MANRTFGSSALKDDDLNESNETNVSDEIKFRSKVIDFGKAKKIRDFNETNVSSLKEAVVILKKIEEIDGELKSDSILGKYIENFLGKTKVDNISDLITTLEALVNLDEVKSDELKTSVVDEEKIKELVKEYENYLDNGLNDKEALDQVYKNNKGEVSLKEIENFVKEQREIYQENFEKLIEEKSSEVAEEIAENSEEIVDKKNIEKKVKEVILGEQNKIDINNSSEKIIQLELDKWIEANQQAISEVKEENLEKRIRLEIGEKNPDLSGEEKNQVDNYIKFVKDFYYSPKTTDLTIYKEEAVSYAETVGLSPGQINNGWDNIQTLNGLVNSKEKPIDLINQYNALKEKLGEIAPTKIKECNSLDLVSRLMEKSEGFRNLVEKTQKIVNWKENLASSFISSVGLDKLMINMAGKVLGEEFVKNSLVILAQKSFEQGSMIVLQSFITGGNAALSVAAASVTVEIAQATLVMAQTALVAAQTALEGATVAAAAAVGTAAETATATALVAAQTALLGATTTVASATTAAGAASTALTAVSTTAGGAATAAGTAALSTTGVGAIVAVVLLAVNAIKGIFIKLGISLSDYLKRDLGRVGGTIASAAIFIAGLPLLLFGLIGSIVATPFIIILLVFGGFFGYNQFVIVPPVGGLVPPKGKVEETINNDVDVGNYENINYTGSAKTIGSYQIDGVIYYVFEGANKNTISQGDRYDLGVLDPSLLGLVPEEYWVGCEGKTSNGYNACMIDRRVISPYIALVKAARASGELTGCQLTEDLKLTYGYRTKAQQDAIAANDSNAKYAAPADTISGHRTGRALDLEINCFIGSGERAEDYPTYRASSTYKWLLENASKFGFYPYSVEPWHWVYNPAMPPSTNTL